MDDAARLLNELDRQSGEWVSLIREAQVELRRSGRVIRVLEPTDDAVVTVEVTEHPAAVTLSLGFPFALASAPATTVEQEVDAGFAVDIRRTGILISAYQRELLADAVGTRGRSLDWRETASRAEFRALADEVLVEPRQLAVFADRFTYLGDAIQHRAEWDVFSSVVTARRSVATTCVTQLRGMLGFDPGDALDALACLSPSEEWGALLVMPCWVDSHWRGIVEVVLAALWSHPRSAVLVPGSNLVIVNDGRTVVATHLAIADYRLSESPVEQNSRSALGEFRECAWRVPAPQRRPAAGAVVIAPFASHCAKNLTAVQLSPLVARLREGGAERLVLVSGDPRNTDAASEFDRLAAALPDMEPASADLAEAIGLIAGARLVVAADSGLAHAARRLETPSVTIYNEPYWDGESALGLLHRSVLGFGTANPAHHHLVTGGNAEALTPTQCEAIAWLTSHAVGDVALATQTEQACRAFARLAHEGGAQQIVDAHERLQREELAPGDEWLAADLPLRRLLRPFTEVEADRMARWLATLTMSAKLVSVTAAR